MEGARFCSQQRTIWLVAFVLGTAIVEMHAPRFDRIGHSPPSASRFRSCARRRDYRLRIRSMSVFAVRAAGGDAELAEGAGCTFFEEGSAASIGATCTFFALAIAEASGAGPTLDAAAGGTDTRGDGSDVEGGADGDGGAALGVSNGLDGGCFQRRARVVARTPPTVIVASAAAQRPQVRARPRFAVISAVGASRRSSSGRLAATGTSGFALRLSP